MTLAVKITPSTIVGGLVGLNVLLGLAVVSVIAANGTQNPGVVMLEQPAGTGATAPGPLPLQNGSFEGLDLNRDGRVSLAEAAGHQNVVLRFDRADRNRDGKLTKAEFERLTKLPEPKAAQPKSPRPQIRRDAASAAAGG